MHATEPFTSCLCIANYSLSDRACDGMLIRAHENAARGHIAFSHFGDMQLQFSPHACLYTSGGMLPSAKAHAYSRPIPAHSHMRLCTRCTMYTYACRRAQNPCQRASPTQHCMAAATSRVTRRSNGLSYGVQRQQQTVRCMHDAMTRGIERPGKSGYRPHWNFTAERRGPAS